jgi:hypothetical protein
MGQCVEVSRYISVALYKGEVKRIYFRADAGVANPELHANLEAGGRRGGDQKQVDNRDESVRKALMPPA